MINNQVKEGGAQFLGGMARNQVMEGIIIRGRSQEQTKGPISDIYKQHNNKGHFYMYAKRCVGS